LANRRYSEKEVAELLTRAAELSGPVQAKGTSLDEVERIAAEAGIPSALVRQAAAELSRGKKPAQAPSIWERLFGKGRIRFEAVLPGEIAESDHEELFDIIQENLGLPGTLNRAGRAFSWALQAGPQGGRSVSVHISARNGQTVIRIEERVGNLAGGVWGGLFGGAGGGLAPLAGIGAAALGGPVAAFAAVLATLAAAGLGSRGLYDHLREKRAEELSHLFEALTDAVTQMASGEGDNDNEESALAGVKERLGLKAPTEGKRSTLASAPRVDEVKEIQEEVVEEG
jgi:hypothetical protein